MCGTCLCAATPVSNGNADITRSITALGLSQASHQDTNLTQVFGDFAFAIPAPSMNAVFQPYADIAYLSAETGAFAETGGIGALSGGSKSSTVTYGMPGLRVAGTPGQTLSPKFDLGWQHAFDSFRPGQIVTFANGGQSFTVLGVPLANDAAVVQVGYDYAIAPQAVFSISYDGSFSGATYDHGFRGGFIWKF